MLLLLVLMMKAIPLVKPGNDKLEDKGKSESNTLFYWIPAYFDPDGGGWGFRRFDAANDEVMICHPIRAICSIFDRADTASLHAAGFCFGGGGRIFQPW